MNKWINKGKSPPRPLDYRTHDHLHPRGIITTESCNLSFQWLAFVHKRDISTAGNVAATLMPCCLRAPYLPYGRNNQGSMPKIVRIMLLHTNITFFDFVHHTKSERIEIYLSADLCSSTLPWRDPTFYVVRNSVDILESQ